MKKQSRYDLWYGRDTAPVERRALRAGPVMAQLDGGDLRYVRIGEVELVRRVYVAVRDLNWNTIRAELSAVAVDARDDGFEVRFEARHRQGDIDFSWRGVIIGSPDGSIRYTMDGVADTAFRYAKIGLCIHHPIRENAGRPFRGHAPDGPVGGALPLAIGPQVHLNDGTDLPLFPPVDWLEIDLEGGLTIDFAFEGDLFEMEDQRNWTDASFKTASTPASLGYVHEAEAGTALRQSVTVRVTGMLPATTTATTAPLDELRVTIGESLGRGLPPIGLGMASHGGALAPREIALLRELRPAHLRVDLRLDRPEYPDDLQRALDACRALGCGLELAVFLGGDGDEVPGRTGDEAAGLDGLAALLATAASNGQVPVRHVLVFRAGEEVTAERWVRLARARLGDAAPAALFAGGTNVYFNELNRNRPALGALDAVAYSVNPQIHAFDEASLTEALEGQADTVTSARLFCGNLPIIVSPVTLKPRFNAVATVPEGDRPPHALPDEVDPRQMSLFGAAWTVGSVKRLAESGASSLTYYETTGWRGVMETEAGSPPAAPFPSWPGVVFPLYHVLADVAAWGDGDLLDCRSSDSLTVNALAARVGGALHLLVANMTPRERRVTLTPIRGQRVELRRLNDDSAVAAGAHPIRFRATMEDAMVLDHALTLALAPFEVVLLRVHDLSPDTA